MTAGKSPVPGKRDARILVVDDSTFVRKALRKVFEAHHGLSVAGEAGDGAEAVRMCATLAPDIVTLAKHHALHQFTPRKLQALTVLHNYVMWRADGTTAAERFYGAAPRDCFTWLLDRLAVPARPRARRRAA